MKKTVLAIIIAMFTVSVLGFIGCTLHKHSFSNKVTTEAYLCSSATCTEKAKYYFSCKCGEKSSDTFEYGDPIGHSFTNYVSDNNGSLGKNGTKTAHCDRKGCTATDTILDDGSKSESKISFKTLSVGDKKADGSILVYGKVSNDTKSFSFINEMETVGVIKYVVSLDIYGSQQVATKTIPLNSGDNVVYVIEMLDGEPQSVYEVTIRRRPIYTVSFDTRNGTKIPNQQIEEDSIITEPVTTRAGYTFVNWDYDFSQPITQDVTITANWTANTDTAYKVEYYFGNKDYNYTLCETVNLQGTSGTIVTAEIKTYNHFTLNRRESVLSGSVAGDGSLVLKVYYTRNVYTLSNENTSYGEITNATTKKYGSDKIESVVTAEYLGCEFIGWYNGEELLSTAKDYTFTIEFNVTAKFKVKDEMSNFNFNSFVNDCTITDVKDKTVSEIVIPDYVTSIDRYAFV